MKILLIGENCLDTFVYGNCDRICPEAPVPVFHPIKTKMNGGMIFNVQDNMMSIGSWLDMRYPMDIDVITNIETINKTRYVDMKSNQMIMRLDENDKVDRINLSQYPNIERYDAVVVSDYNKGFLSYEDLLEIADRSNFSILDTKKIISKPYFDAFDFVKINKAEWDLCEQAGLSYEEVKDTLLLTVGSDGAVWCGKTYPVDTSVEVRDVSGAGDTWLAAFVIMYFENGNSQNAISSAIKYANECSTKVVQKRGVTTAYE